jgi:hypothetical protein
VAGGCSHGGDGYRRRRYLSVIVDDGAIEARLGIGIIRRVEFPYRRVACAGPWK